MTSLLAAELTDPVTSAGTVEQLQRAVLVAARLIADADGASVVLRDGEYCFYAAEDTTSPLWKGQRFPIADCISGWAMVHAEQAVVSDIELDERIPVEAYRPTYVRSLVMTPFGGTEPAGAIGVYWPTVGALPSPETLGRLAELGRLAGEALQRVGLATAPWAPNFALRTGPA